MSRANRLIAAVVLVCLAAGPLFLALARGDDLLKDADSRRAVAAQQAERDIRDARDEAYRTAQKQPSKALERIRGLLQLVEVNPNFTDEKRDDLTALLKKDLRDIQKMADAASNPDVPNGYFHPAAKDPRADEQKKLIDGALARITSSREALSESEELRAKKSEALRNLLVQVDQSSIPPTSEFEFPRNWRELSMRRLQKNMLTATERALLKALDARISPDFTDQRLGAVVDWFQKTMGQTIVLDKPAMDEINVNSESVVSLHLNKVTTRTALKKVLADLGLTYVVKDETIFVTTPTKAKDMMTVRTYYIGDLIPQYDMRFGPSLSQYQAMTTIAQMVNMIQNNIDKESWEINGREGGGTVVFDPATMSLIVKQSAEVHYKMMQGLAP